jgi:uncharacterized membrane protein
MFDLVVSGLLGFVFFAGFMLTVALGLMSQFLDPTGMGYMQAARYDQHFGIALFGLLGAIFVVGRLVAVIAAIREFRGKRFRYPMIGAAAERYLTRPMT